MSKMKSNLHHESFSGSTRESLLALRGKSRRSQRLSNRDPRDAPGQPCGLPGLPEDDRWLGLGFIADMRPPSDRRAPSVLLVARPSR